jgi:hypothetical protein
MLSVQNYFSASIKMRVSPASTWVGKSWQVVDARRLGAVHGKCFSVATGASFAIGP